MIVITSQRKRLLRSGIKKFFNAAVFIAMHFVCYRPKRSVSRPDERSKAAAVHSPVSFPRLLIIFMHEKREKVRIKGEEIIKTRVVDKEIRSKFELLTSSNILFSLCSFLKFCLHLRRESDPFSLNRICRTD